MNKAVELRTLAGGVMKRDAARRRALSLKLRGWQDMSVQTVEAFADLLELLDAFASDPSGSDTETVNDIRTAVDSGWQRLAAIGVTVDGMAGEAFAPDCHQAIQEVETQASSTRWVARTIEHGLVMRGERIRRAKVVISGRRPS
jgi:molecular chaperone GrpE (heat shock protein)